MNSKIDAYFKLQNKIYKYFGYEENWVAIPIDDRREMYWSLVDDSVNYWKYKENTGKWTDGDGWSDKIYKQRFLDKWVYEGEEFTMVCVGTKTDGNKFLAIYDNSKRI